MVAAGIRFLSTAGNCLLPNRSNAREFAFLTIFRAQLAIPRQILDGSRTSFRLVAINVLFFQWLVSWLNALAPIKPVSSQRSGEIKAKAGIAPEKLIIYQFI